jgi:tetratricopeptide (TPR) repeat protein
LPYRHIIEAANGNLPGFCQRIQNDPEDVATSRTIRRALWCEFTGWADFAALETRRAMVDVRGDRIELDTEAPPSPRRRRTIPLVLRLAGNVLGGVLASALIFWCAGWRPVRQERQLPAPLMPVSQLAPSAPADRVLDAPADEPVRPAAERLNQADLMFLSGNHAGALLAYDELLKAEDAVTLDEGQLRYRRSLCLELLGKAAEAMKEFRAVSDTLPSPALADAALLGQFRVLCRQERYEPAAALLAARWLTCGDRAAIVPYLLHSAAQLASFAVRPPTDSLLDDTAIISLVEHHGEADLLGLANDAASNGAAPAEPVVPGGVKVVDRFSDHPRDMLVTIRLEATVAEVLNRISGETHLTIVVPDTVQQLLNTRTTNVVVQDTNLASVLDALLETAGTFWTVREQQITVHELSRAEPALVRSYRVDRALRTARNALALYPEAPTAHWTYLCLGNVNFWSGNFTDALSAYQELERRVERREFAYAVWFNQAKTYMQLRQLQKARETFFHAIDELGGDSVEAVAYAYLGRLFLEDAEVENANRYLARGLSLARGDDTRQVCAIILACGYLQANNPQAANQTLFDHRDVLKAEPVLSQASFVSALARFRAAVGSTEQLRRGRDLASALAAVEPSRFFSTVGYLLVGQAYAEIGLPNSMVDVLRTGIEASPDNVLREQMQWLLAEHFAEYEKWPAAEEAYQRLVTDGRTDLARRARFGLARIDFDRGQYQSCLSRCYELISATASLEEKTEILRLMGRVYERQAEHYKAALCFAGMVPGVRTDSTSFNP